MYLGVLQAVEQDGWDVMHWQANYTLLHWAAKKNYFKLVQYIVLHFLKSVDALLLRDDQEKTPADYA